jgi:threonine dehydrogenase-like Zn-dependent dehydrogenase
MRMKAKGVRLYSSKNMKLEEFELPKLEEDEVLVKIICSGLAMSTLKEVTLAQRHLRVPKDIRKNPIIIGHEFTGVIEDIGGKWKSEYYIGERVVVIPEIPGQIESPGYSYPYFGGACTYCIVPGHVIDKGCLMQCQTKSFYEGAMAQALYSIVSSFYSNYHSVPGTHQHISGIKPGGNTIILGGCGPMGVLAIHYVMQMDTKPRRLVVTDTNRERLEKARKLISMEEARRNGIELYYINPGMLTDPVPALMALTEEKGYDDVFVYAPPKNVAEIGNRIMAMDGCMNIYASTADKKYEAGMNIYGSHYLKTKLIGSSGGLYSDMKEALKLIARGQVNPALNITHIGGLSATVDGILDLKKMQGEKKIIYNQLDFPLIEIKEFRNLGKEKPLFQKLADSCDSHKGLWNPEAEKILLNHYKIQC